MQLSWPIVSHRDRLSHADRALMDRVWSEGWRHFGRDFFRDSLTLMNGEVKRVIPLRVLLDEWSPSKSERRTIKRNAHFVTEWGEARMGQAERDLFHLHKSRFSDNVPEGLENFLGWSMDDYPCECMQCSVYEVSDKGRELIACSYLDLGQEAVSSVYAMFHPDYSQYRLGIYTMICELLYAQERGATYLYSGYATLEPSSYDYKKSFRPQEFFNWQDEWKPLSK